MKDLEYTLYEIALLTFFQETLVFPVDFTVESVTVGVFNCVDAPCDETTPPKMRHNAIAYIITRLKFIYIHLICHTFIIISQVVPNDNLFYYYKYVQSLLMSWLR